MYFKKYIEVFRIARYNIGFLAYSNWLVKMSTNIGVIVRNTTSSSSISVRGATREAGRRLYSLHRSHHVPLSHLSAPCHAQLITAYLMDENYFALFIKFDRFNKWRFGALILKPRTDGSRMEICIDGWRIFVISRPRSGWCEPNYVWIEKLWYCRDLHRHLLNWFVYIIKKKDNKTFTTLIKIFTWQFFLSSHVRKF